MGPDQETGAFIRQLEQWTDMVVNAWEPLVLLDADMLCRGSLQDTWVKDYDVGITVRHDEQRYNAGAVFVRPTPAAAHFCWRWLTVLKAFCATPDSGEELRHQWGSLDQAALAHLLKDCEPDAEVAELPCEKWNACQQNWAEADDPALVHCKGRLRELVLEGDTSAMGLGSYVEEWHRYV